MNELKNRIHDDNIGLGYTLVGGFYLPDLESAESEQQPTGAWGQRHKRFLKEHHKGLYHGLLQPCGHLFFCEKDAIIFKNM